MDLVKIFNTIRDIPYNISVDWDVENLSCIGKHNRFFDSVSAQGYSVRYRLCTFRWSGCGLPKNVLDAQHDDECVHTYCEVLIQGRWVVADLTWDYPLRNMLPVNEWDGKSDCKISVSPIRIFSPKESEKKVKARSKESFVFDRKRNGEFYTALNAWLDSVREK